MAQKFGERKSMSELEEYVTIARTDEVPEDQPLVVVHNGWRIAIYRDSDQYYACLDVCPHMGAFLSRGYCEGVVVTCPWHNWEFDLRTGQCLSNESGLTVQKFDIKEVNGILQIPLSSISDGSEDEFNEEEV